MSQEKHVHDYRELVFIPVIQDDPAIRAEKTKYIGVGFELAHFGKVVSMAILVRRCTCGSQEAFEYGERKKMKELLTRLKGEEHE